MQHISANTTTWQFFISEMNTDVVRRQQIDSNLHQALKRGEFILH